MPDLGAEGLEGQSRSEWLREVFENSDHFQHLADMLNSGRLFEKAWAPLLRDLRARGWISDQDLALWHSRPVWSALRWVVSEARAAARERRVAVGAGKEPGSSSAFPGERARRRVLAKDRDGGANVAEEGV